MSKTRIASFCFAALVAAAMLTTAFAADPQYKKIKDISVGGAGGWDYLRADAENQRLYVSHGTKVVVIDTKEDKVIGEITNTPGVHGFAVANDLKRGFSSNGQANTASIIDLDSKDAEGKPTFKEIMTVKTGGNPDWIFYEPTSGEVWTCNGRGGSFTAFDAKTGKVIAESVATGGKPETAQADPKLNRVFINVEDKNEVISVDLKEHKVLERWPLGAGNNQPTGMAYVPDLQRIIVGCSKMVMMDATNGKVVSTLNCGSGVDAASYDPETKLAFVSAGGSGTVTIAKVEADKLTAVQTLTTERGARTMTVDTKTHKIYLANTAAGNFKVMVFGIDDAAAKP
jgi:DNA-binding beta-propeller fold protein YncE